MTAVEVETTFYLAVMPKHGRVWRGGTMVDGIEKITVTGVTQSRPKSLRGGAVAVKLTLRFNEQAFMPLQPEAVIVIPDSFVLANQVIEVEAEDPNDAAAIEALLQSRSTP